MTFGNSRTVLEFLKAAGKKRKFEVIVPESAPSSPSCLSCLTLFSFNGQALAVTLSKAGIETTLITDAAIFAMMARVNKVIVGTHAGNTSTLPCSQSLVMANGGLIAKNGTHMIALAAKHHAVPFVVCTGLYKLCPLYPYDQDTFNDVTSPSAVLKFEEGDRVESCAQ